MDALQHHWIQTLMTIVSVQSIRESMHRDIFLIDYMLTSPQFFLFTKIFVGFLKNLYNFGWKSGKFSRFRENFEGFEDFSRFFNDFEEKIEKTFKILKTKKNTALHGLGSVFFLHFFVYTIQIPVFTSL